MSVSRIQHNNVYAGLMRNASVRLELYDWMYGNVTLSVLFVNAWSVNMVLDRNPGLMLSEFGTD